MKTQRRFLALAFLLSALNPQLSTVFAQGSLTPPGAPAPTMKTLQQVEPRTDVLTLAGNANYQFIINTPGSYYLTTNIVGVAGKAGILINAFNVTLDLNGFELLGVLNSFDAIYVASSAANAIINNGTLKNWGGQGVNASAPGAVSAYNIPAGNTYGPLVILGFGLITGAGNSTGWENFDYYVIP